MKRYFYNSVMSGFKSIEDDELIDILDDLENYLLEIEEREPNSNGVILERWQEKYDDLQDLVEIFRNYIESSDMYRRKEILNKLKRLTKLYQINYGGLKRLLV